ncbi:hypothetical protein ACSW9P_15545 [Clostridium perfringens]
MDIRDYEIYKREGSEITPNSFNVYIDDEVKKDAFILSFAEVKEEEKRVDILSEIVLNEEGVKAVFKRTIRILIEYENKTGKDLLKESFGELVSELGGDK